MLSFDSTKILIIEDEGIVALELEKRLSNLGYNVVGTYANGTEAINNVPALSPDIVLMDIIIKGDLDGIETAAKMSSEYALPIVFLTAHADVDTVARSRQAGAFGYIVKPFDESKLYATIETAIVKYKAQRNLENITEKLAKNNNDLRQFAYIASHDLQEPLRMIVSFLKLIKKRQDSEASEKEIDEYIDYALSGATRMQELLFGLLRYTKVDSTEKNFQKADLQKALEKAVSNLSKLLEEHEGAVSQEGLPTINADEMQMIQLFQNLISNAVKFRGIHAPQIHIKAESKAGNCIVYVSDNGIGIEPQHSKVIFDIFKQLHPHTKFEGSGIGLSICKRIVDRHEGKIWIEKSSQSGTTFAFSIPQS